jgi:hypothetical protein
LGDFGLYNGGYEALCVLRLLRDSTLSSQWRAGGAAALGRLVMGGGDGDGSAWAQQSGLVVQDDGINSPAFREFAFIFGCH